MMLMAPSGALNFPSKHIIASLFLFLGAACGTASIHGKISEYGGNETAVKDASDYPATYFALPDHYVLIYSHIALMVLAWVFVLPVAVMLSIAQSRLTLAAQYSFLAVNSLGVLLATFYNLNTPDLYPNNSHHAIGWIATSVVSAQAMISLTGRLAGALNGRGHSISDDSHTFNKVPNRGLYAPLVPQYQTEEARRFSNDSGQGTEPETGSSRGSSTPLDQEEHVFPDVEKETGGRKANSGSLSFLSTLKDSLANKAVYVVWSQAWKYLQYLYKAIDRTILPFGFIALTTGIVTFGRFFEGRAIFSGLAHWIKGGAFFWLGLLTLGRWSGSFAELGWAWNLKPPTKEGRRWQPSAEFVESALIFFYGSTNIFLEHLGGWGGDWSAQDLEHLSITVLFIGGGLCGMLVESTSLRTLLNTTASTTLPTSMAEEDGELDKWHIPLTYSFSLNPVPSLIILILGTMMSSHHQSTTIATMLHRQWGNLLLGASFARVLTYILLFLRPPKSVLPSRPPTELLVSFSLIAGGIIFMASSADTIDGMIHYNLDAMFIYMITMGSVGLLMAWVIIVLSLKGWATQKERKHNSWRCS